MNFIEAVRILKDGGCEGIIADDGCVYKISGSNNQLNFAGAGGGAMGMCQPVDNILGDWQLVNPTPQTETKGVTIYASVDSTSGRVWNIGTKEEMEIAVSPDSGNLIKIVELTGTYERHVKPKVKHREELTMCDGQRWRPVHQDSKIPADASVGHFFFEWEE